MRWLNRSADEDPLVLSGGPLSLDDAAAAATLRRGFDSAESQRILGELWLSAARIMSSWVTSGKIYALTSQQGRPVQRSWVIEYWGEEATAELVEESVSRALTRLKDDIQHQHWREDGGASLLSFFVTGCVQEFPNTFRKIRTRLNQIDRPTEPDAVQQVADRQQSDARLPSFHTWWALNDEISSALKSKDPLLRQILGHLAEGYTAAETAQSLGVSPRSVETRIHRFRIELRNQPEPSADTRGRHRDSKRRPAQFTVTPGAPARIEGTFNVDRHRHRRAT